MSWQAIDKVLDAEFPDMPRGPTRRRGVSAPVLKLVCLVFAHAVDAQGSDAHPGIRRVARRADVTPDQARHAIDALVELEVLVLRQRSDGRRSDRYDLDLDRLAALWKPRRSARLGRALPIGPSRALARGSEPRGARGSEPREIVLRTDIPRAHFDEPVDLNGLSAQEWAMRQVRRSSS